MIKEPVEIPDLSKILDLSHENKWVALSADYSKVLATADTLRELFENVSDPQAIFHRVLPLGVTFAP